MKKVAQVLATVLLALSIGACSCHKETQFKSVLENSNDVYSGSKTTTKLTTQDIYDYLRNNGSNKVNKYFLSRLIETALNVNGDNKKLETYNLKVKQYFEDNYLNVDTYKINGVFNEELLANYLESRLYVIDKVNSPSSGPTHDLGLHYDYSDYIKRGLNYDIYMEMLKEDYISNNRQAVLNNSNTRIISVFSTDDLEDMEEIVKDLYDGKYTNLEELANSKREAEIEELGRQYCVNLGLENEYYEGTCSPSTSSSTYDSALYKFTVCENGVRCSLEEGFAYQIKLAQEKEYVKEQVVNKYTTDLLYSKAVEQLFRDDVEDRLVQVIDGEDKFLLNGLYNSDANISNKDIILSEGPGLTCYLVTVRVVNSQTESVEDRERGFSLLLDKINETTVLLHYLENLDIEVTDAELKTYYNQLVGKN